MCFTLFVNRKSASNRQISFTFISENTGIALVVNSVKVTYFGDHVHLLVFLESKFLVPFVTSSNYEVLFYGGNRFCISTHLAKCLTFLHFEFLPCHRWNQNSVKTT